MNALERMDLQEAYTDLAAKAILRRHPHAMWLAHKPARDLNDRLLVAAVERLRAWLDEHGD